MSSARLEALKTPAPIGSPGADGGAVEFWISDGGGSGYLSKRPSAGPSSRMTVDILAQWKVSLGMVTEDKKTASYERPRHVTWDWYVTRISSNCCVSSAFGKWALTTADEHWFLRSKEHFYPWPIRSRLCIRGGARIMIGGGGVNNNEKLLYRNFWYNPTW